MKVLVVEPMKPCYVREIEGLKAMQEIVGGHIEAIYPFKEQVAIIANEKGKLMGLPYNRPLLDENGVPYDIGGNGDRDKANYDRGPAAYGRTGGPDPPGLRQ